MNLSIEDINETRKKLVVSVTADEAASEEKEILRDFSGKVRIPGFRQGRAPETIVRSRFSKELNGELSRKLAGKAYEHAIEESGFEIYTVVEVDGGEFASGQDGEISVMVDILPEFNLPDYDGINTKVPTAEVSDEEVETAIDELRKQRSEFQVVERAAELGDYVKVSYVGTIDGRTIADLAPERAIWGTQENTWEEAGAEEGVGVEAVVKGVVGMAAGDSKQETMSFPAEFEVEELAGKDAAYEIEVHEVRQRVLPEINEEFLKSMRLESAELLKDQIYDDLKSRKEQLRRNRQRTQVTNELDARIEFSLPESAVESETESVMREVVEQNVRRGIGEDQLDAHKQEIFDSARRTAGRRVKMNILLTRIGKEEGIEVDEEDVQRYLMSEAIATRVQVEQLVKDYQKDRQRGMAMQRAILVEKTLARIIEKTVIEEVEESEDGHDHNHDH
jgi:trigger factor